MRRRRRIEAYGAGRLRLVESPECVKSALQEWHRRALRRLQSGTCQEVAFGLCDVLEEHAQVPYGPSSGLERPRVRIRRLPTRLGPRRTRLRLCTGGAAGRQHDLDLRHLHERSGREANRSCDEGVSRASELPPGEGDEVWRAKAQELYFHVLPRVDPLEDGRQGD